jgi:class 3 adenylate cyclase
MSPPELVALLNRYLGHMSEVILHHDGLIVEFIGDAILVLFGAPNPQPDDAERAGRCALEMQTRLDALNHELVAAGISELQMGIALHTGEVVVGNIGSEHRVKYGVVGDAVNRTSRIEGLAAAGQVVISSDTRAALGEAGVVGPVQAVHVKGIAEELHLYLLSDIT